MTGFDPDRRKALGHIALLGAAGLVPALLPVRSARAADFKAGFVYIGPRDWIGAGTSRMPRGGRPRGCGGEAGRGGYLPRAPTTAAARTMTRPGLRAGHRGLVAAGAGWFFDAFDDDPFLLPQWPGNIPLSPSARLRCSPQGPAEPRQPERVDQPGPLRERRGRGPQHEDRQTGFRRRQAVRRRAV